MGLYYALFLYAIILGLVCQHRIMVVSNGTASINKGYIKEFKKDYIILVFFCVFLIVGLRGMTVGADTVGYYEEYYLGVQERGIFKGDIELLFNFIIWTTLLFSKDYQFFLLIYSIIICILFSRFIYKNSTNILLSMIIFIGMFFVQSMNLMREWLAVGFGLNAYTFYKQNKSGLGFLFIVFAIFTHMTAAALLLMPIVLKSKNKKTLAIVIALMSIFVVLFETKILALIVKIVPRYHDYVYHPYFTSDSGGLNIKDLIFAVIIIGYIFVLYSNKSLSKQEQDNIYEHITFMIIALALSLCGQKFSILHRVVYYYSAFLIIGLPTLTRKFKYSKLLGALVVAAMFVMLYRNSYWDNNIISQYLFFWQ